MPKEPAGGDSVSSECPDHFVVHLETTAGIIEIEVHRAWSPLGAARFHALVEAGYYDDSRFFRVVAGKWAQFGIAGRPALAQAWRGSTIPDDPRVQSNQAGFVAFANTGPNTRSTQIFINLGDNSAQNDREHGFAPFGKVFAGMDAAAALHAGYGETSGGGLRAGRQESVFAEGNAFLDRNFPRLDRLIRAHMKSAPPQPQIGNPT
jgi:homoserine O-acetyltransferase